MPRRRSLGHPHPWVTGGVELGLRTVRDPGDQLGTSRPSKSGLFNCACPPDGEIPRGFQVRTLYPARRKSPTPGMDGLLGASGLLCA